MIADKLASLGFQHSLTLTWGELEDTFKFVPVVENILASSSVIYVWYDRHNGVIMYVGFTGRTMKARFINSSGYEHWLNGLMKRQINRPIRHLWLDHIKTSKSGSVEVHICHFAKESLQLQERRFMDELTPKLNKRR